MARSEFSRLRGIVQKRSSRLAAAGFSGLQVPKAAELSAEGREAWVRTMQNWISGGASTLKEARAKAAAAEAARERRKQQQREASRRYRQTHRKQISKKRRVRALVSQGFSRADANFIARMKQDYGIAVTAETLQDWKDYLSERYAQQVDKKKYEFDKWVESFDDWKEATEQELTGADLLADKEAFMQEQQELRNALLTTRDFSKSEMDVFLDVVARKKSPIKVVTRKTKKKVR